MATYKSALSRAPAREALIDIQFAPAIPEDAIKIFTELAKARFEQVMPMWQAVFGFAVGPDGTAQHPPPSRAAIGARLESSNPPHVLQCRTSGFTFSRLSPYGCWDELRAAAKAEWDLFLTVAPPFVINRIAVRYINELQLPVPFKDFEEFLSCAPDVPPELPPAVSSFLQRVVIPDPENDCTSIVTQALEALAPLSKYVPVLLDIDVSRTVEINSANSEKIWQGLDQLRVQKNRMFFAHITDKMVELLK